MGGVVQAPWIVASLFIALPALVAAGAIETSRQTPLLNLRWLGRGDVARFAVAIFMARIVLAEQAFAIGVVREPGRTAQQLATLSMAMLGGAVAGVLISALTVNARKLARPMMLSVGITNVLQHGSRELISFIVLFGIVNALGALAGPALLGSHNDWSRAVGGTTLDAMLNTSRLVAVIAGFTTIYLAFLLTLRIRRRLAELRSQHDTGPAFLTGVADTPIALFTFQRRPPMSSSKASKHSPDYQTHRTIYDH